MRMVMISYNSAIDTEVVDALNKNKISNFTRWIQVQGRGSASGCHFASEVWPGENTVIFTAVDDSQAQNLFDSIKKLRKRLAKEGIKAFSWDLVELT